MIRLKSLALWGLVMLVALSAGAAFAGTKEGISAYEKQKYTVALKEFTHAAEKGKDPVAQYWLGVMYTKGQGVPVERSLGLKWLVRSAELGHAPAQHELAEAFVGGNGVPQDETKAAKWYLAAAEKGVVEAQYKLSRLLRTRAIQVGERLKRGEKLCSDSVTCERVQAEIKELFQGADKWLQSAAEKGHPRAQLEYAFRREDQKEQFKWLQAAAEQGLADAQVALGAAYSKGEGVARDFEQSMIWNRRAADQGNTDAMLNIYIMYLLGQGVEKNNNEALRWLRLAAEKGDLAAINNMAIAHLEGTLVPKDSNEALRWWGVAGAKGDMASQYNLAQVYLTGYQGVKQNPVEGLRWMRSAAEAGNPAARVDLAWYYYHGRKDGDWVASHFLAAAVMDSAARFEFAPGVQRSPAVAGFALGLKQCLSPSMQEAAEAAGKALAEPGFNTTLIALEEKIKRERAQRAASVKKEAFTVNGVTFEMAMLPASQGGFMMGSCHYEAGRIKDFESIHEQEVKSFRIGVTEVTQELFDTVMGKPPLFWQKSHSFFEECGPKCPADFTAEDSFSKVEEFIEKLSRMTGKKFRLATEAEWEYAARADCPTPFNVAGQCKSQIEPDEANFDAQESYMGSRKGESLGKTVKVGSYAPNSWGLYDMYGNVGEWVQDCRTPYGEARRGCSGVSRVVRGGAYWFGPIGLRAAHRSWMSGRGATGFRLAMSAD
jgi:TPR repeat protein/formylglycine-generating enzyme required for sulfatase activity